MVFEALMLEYTVASGVRLYHRSTRDFKVGDVLTAQKNDKGKHWLSYHLHERGLEAFRVKRDYEPAQRFTARERKKKSFIEPERKFKSFENLPSRFECIYATFVPHSRFLSKGQLYVVEPIGATHVVDSRIIDQLSRLPVDYRSLRDDPNDEDEGRFEDQREAESLYRDYWEGTEPTRANLQNLEIFMDSARVVEVVNETTQPLHQGNNFMVAGGPVLLGKLELRGDSVSWGQNKQTLEDFIIDSAGLQGFELGKIPEGDYFRSITVKLTQGFKGKILTMRLPEPGNLEQDPYSTRLQVTPSELSYPVDIQFMGDQVINFMKSVRKGFIKKI